MEQKKLDPQKMIEAYKNAAPKYRKGRAGAALIHANDPRLSAEQRAYWQAIADALKV